VEREGTVNLSDGLEKAIWDILYAEAMYTDLDLEDEETQKVISDVLNKIAKQLGGKDE
jgi:hypothetical protein